MEKQEFMKTEKQSTEAKKAFQEQRKEQKRLFLEEREMPNDAEDPYVPPTGGD
jgi:hypothetical protein